MREFWAGKERSLGWLKVLALLHGYNNTERRAEVFSGTRAIFQKAQAITCSRQMACLCITIFGILQFNQSWWRDLLNFDWYFISFSSEGFFLAIWCCLWIGLVRMMPYKEIYRKSDPKWATSRIGTRTRNLSTIL